MKSLKDMKETLAKRASELQSSLDEKKKDKKNKAKFKLPSDINYKNCYGIFRKLPLINFYATMVLVLIWGIIDAFEYITDIGGELEAAGVFVWLIIGLIPAAISYFFTAILMSPTVLRTDASLEMVELMKKNSASGRNDIDELPDL